MEPVSKTAFYTAGLRMQDATSSHPIVGDDYAKRFMDEQGLSIFEKFLAFRNANASNLYRHRIIDDYVRRELDRERDIKILIIGAGFDARAFRFSGGTWIEVDEGRLLEYKNAKLPISECKNSLSRVSIDFTEGELQQKLAAFGDDARVLVIVEGVLMYLNEADIRQLAMSLRGVFPRHTLICDLMNRKFARRYSRPLHERLRELGTTFDFALTTNRPETLFQELGYRLQEKISIVQQAASAGMVKIPEFVLNLFLRSLKTGYSVIVFNYP